MFDFKISEFTLQLKQSYYCPQFSETMSSRLQTRIQNPVIIKDGVFINKS